jgi:hypothetical protein
MGGIQVSTGQQQQTNQQPQRGGLTSQGGTLMSPQQNRTQPSPNTQNPVGRRSLNPPPRQEPQPLPQGLLKATAKPIQLPAISLPNGGSFVPPVGYY